MQPRTDTATLTIIDWLNVGLVRNRWGPAISLLAETSTANTAIYKTEFMNFSSKWFNPPRLQFLLGSSFKNWRAVYCFSVRKAFINACLHFFSVGLNFIIFQFAEVSGWFVPKIIKLRLNLSKLCLEYCGLFFSWTRCMCWNHLILWYTQTIAVSNQPR